MPRYFFIRIRKDKFDHNFSEYAHDNFLISFYISRLNFPVSDRTNASKESRNESGNKITTIERYTSTEDRNNLSQTNTHISINDPVSFVPTCYYNVPSSTISKKCFLVQSCPDNIKNRQNVSSFCPTNIQYPTKRIHISPSEHSFVSENLMTTKRDVVIIKRSTPEVSDSDSLYGDAYECVRDCPKKQDILWSDFPYTRDQIGRMPVSKFNDLILKLDEMRVHVARDIRRKFKNKIAARNCRKRKIQQIDHLDTGVESLESNLHRLQTENKDLKKDIAELTKRLSWLDQQIFEKLKERDGGQSFSEKTHSLLYANDKVFLVSQPPKKTVTITVQ